MTISLVDKENRMPLASAHSGLLRLLIVEDMEDDALLLVDHLRAGGWDFEWCHVDSAGGLREALAERCWDIVLSDYSMPGFSGSHALDMVRERDPDVPFILVSGAIGERAAVEAIKAGANDYVMKDNLARLLPTVDRELREARSRRESRAAEQERRRLAAILEATTDLVAILDRRGGVRYLNLAGRALLGLPEASAERPLGLADLFPERVVRRLTTEIFPWVRREGSWSGETALLNGQHSELPVSQVVLAHRDVSGRIEYLSTIARDISERKRFEAELEHRASHDGLTDLPNRHFLIDRFSSALQRARRHGRCVAVLFLDLNNFKRVNDSLGHAAGDALLREVARRLKRCLRPNDTVARHGGDEFTLVVDDLNHAESALSVLSKLNTVFSTPVDVGAHEVYVTFSTGIALYPHDGDNVDDLLRHADTAMYRAKSSGSSQYRFYSPEMNARGQEFLLLEADLGRAIEQGEFRLYGQPQIDMRSGRVAGIEGLIRWHHPQRGMVPPNDFIPLLENSGMIIPVGEWVLREACRQHRHWCAAGFGSQRISVNVSAAQFNDDDFLGKIRRALREEAMQPQRLELEITENVVMQDPVAATELLCELHALGVRTAIDDFGTGYSSLGYLKRFPLNVLKIDRTFVTDLDTDPGDAVIVEASISLAHKLGLEIVAEGVESESQLAFLRQHDCDLAQGFCLSRPLPEADVPALFPRQWN